MDKQTCWQISNQGRLRWCIENEGFNTQKNGGYHMQHKFSRKEPGAKKNYYDLLQIAHLINQVAEKLQRVKDQLQASKQAHHDRTLAGYDVLYAKGSYRNNYLSNCDFLH